MRFRGEGDKWPGTWRSWSGKRGAGFSLEHIQVGTAGTAVNTENARMFKGLHNQSGFHAGPLAAASLLHPALGGR